MSNRLKTEPLVSVIMPCKDAERFIEAAISSVLAQTHQNLQLIVVDDASSDGTVKIVDAFAKSDSRVSLVKLSDNSGGPAKPRNTGLTHANGEFVAFIDADDIWLPHKLALQLEVMLLHELNFCSTMHRHFEDDAIAAAATKKMLRNNGRPAAPAITRLDHSMILRKNRIVTSSVVLRASLLEYLHFSEETHYVAIEDYLAWLQLHQRPNVKSAILKQPLVLYRTRNDSISSSKLEMARKIYTLLSLYEVQGQRLGVIRFYYFGTYFLGGVKALVSGWVHRISR